MLLYKQVTVDGYGLDHVDLHLGQDHEVIGSGVADVDKAGTGYAFSIQVRSSCRLRPSVVWWGGGMDKDVGSR